jgi:hypothetical protein
MSDDDELVPWPYYTLREAVRVLGLPSERIIGLAKAGSLEATRKKPRKNHGAELVLEKTAVDALATLLEKARQTG